MYYQQGDLILESAGCLPDGELIRPHTDVFVLAAGEATGHAHTVLAEAGVEIVLADDILYLRNRQATSIRHEEHHTISIPPGVWRVRRVREYDHFAEQPQEVED